MSATLTCKFEHVVSILGRLRIHWRPLTIFKIGSKSVWSNVFCYVKVCIFWKCIQYTIHWDKTQMLKIFPSEKIDDTKNALFFLSRAPTHHSFTFNLRHLYELNQKVRPSKTVCDFPFSIPFRFYLKFIFLFNNMHGLFDFKTLKTL